MSDLISRQAAIDAVKEYFKFSPLEGRQCAKAIERVPSVQPRQRKWIEASEDWRNQITWWQCSECGTPSSIRSNFCPNCGADMRENKKPKSCFECEYSSEIDEDTVLCTEIKTMMSTSQNRNIIPPFCPKYLD